MTPPSTSLSTTSPTRVQVARHRAGIVLAVAGLVVMLGIGGWSLVASAAPQPMLASRRDRLQHASAVQGRMLLLCHAPDDGLPPG